MFYGIQTLRQLLPPEILRFLMIRTPPRKTVNFSTDFEYLVKLYNEIVKHMDQMPPGVSMPLVKTRAIDDVPMLALTARQLFASRTARLAAPHLV